MKLADLVRDPGIHISPDECWAVLGPEAEAFKTVLPAVELVNSLEAEPDGLLLAGALSAQTDADVWLTHLATAAREGTILIAIDWQADGPLDYGPDLQQRFKRGKLSRILREIGFGIVETIKNRPAYYIIQAVKGPPPAVPHAGEFVPVATLDELPKNGMKVVELFGHEIIVANTGKEIIAMARACPHANSPLDKGLLRGRHIVCRLHAYMWNVKTGAPVQPDDEDTLPLYPVKIDEERAQILVALAPY